MSKLNDFLKTNDLFLTLTNEQGEKYEAGVADYVRPLNTKTTVRWHVDGKYPNIFPFTFAVLHGKRKIFDALAIKPVLPGNESIIELVY